MCASVLISDGRRGGEQARRAGSAARLLRDEIMESLLAHPVAVAVLNRSAYGSATRRRRRRRVPAPFFTRRCRGVCCLRRRRRQRRGRTLPCGLLRRRNVVVVEARRARLKERPQLFEAGCSCGGALGAICS